MTGPVASRTFRPALPTDLRRTLGPLRHGGPDRTCALNRSEFWRATRTPIGPGVERLVANGPDIMVTAWGPGREWLVDAAPRLVGADDHENGFVAHHPIVAEFRRRFIGLRIPRTDAVFEALMPTVLEQKVTGREAHESYGKLLRVLGDAAPMPAGGPPLRLPPEPKVVFDTPSHVFHAANVERKRSDALRRGAGYAHRLEECAAHPMPEFYRRIQAIPGLGPWTAAEVASTALGDADAVSVGDYHLKNMVAWALLGQPRGTDEQMLELLEPYRPHRGRVVRLLSLGGVSPPKYGPRLAIQPRW